MNSNKINLAVFFSRSIMLSRTFIVIFSVFFMSKWFIAHLGYMLLITIIALLIMIAIAVAFYWVRMDDRSVDTLMQNMFKNNGRKSGIILFMLSLELLLFSVSLYLSIYSIFGLLSFNFILSHLLSAVVVIAAAISYVHYLQSKNIINIYSNVFSSNFLPQDTLDKRLGMPLQILLFFVYVGLVVFAILKPDLFAALSFALAGTSSISLVLGVLSILFGLIFVYANTPNQKWVAGVFFSLLAVCLMFMSFSSLLGFMFVQGVVLSSAVEIMLWSLVSLVGLLYGVVSYKFKVQYDLHYYRKSLEAVDQDYRESLRSFELGSGDPLEVNHDSKPADDVEYSFSECSFF